LDARDPLGCRCPDVESYIRSISPNKKIILLLNKMGGYWSNLMGLLKLRSHALLLPVAARLAAKGRRLLRHGLSAL